MKSLRSFAACAIVLAAPASAYATMPEALTVAEADAAIAAAQKASPPDTETVWVTNQFGVPIAMAHPNCAPEAGIQGAYGKAQISAQFAQPSLNFDPRYSKNPLAVNSPTVPALSSHADGWHAFNPSQGAEPYFRKDSEGNNDLVAVVACGGGSADQDEVCALAGVAALQKPGQ